MVPLAVLFLGGVAMGRLQAPIWWPAVWAGVVSPIALVWLASARSAEGIDYPVTGSAAFDVVGAIILFAYVGYCSFGVGAIWRRRLTTPAPEAAQR